MTSTPEQVIAKIREALEAGPTLEEWHVGDKWIYTLPSTGSATDGLENVFREKSEDEIAANISYAVAVQPQNIAVLMGEITDLQSVVQCMNEDFAAVKAERDALRKALEPFARIADMEEKAGPADSVMVNVARCRGARTLLAGDNHE